MTVSKDLNKGFKWGSIMQFAVTGIRFFSTITLARLLTPYDYGLIGTVSIFIALGDMFVDSGMGASLLRKKDVKKKDYHTLFIYNFGISLILFCFLFFAAPYISDFFDKPVLVNILRILSLSTVINALTRVQYIQLLRDLRYKLFAVIALVSNSIALIVAIYLAYSGYGVWALVMQQLLQCSISSILYFYYNRFIPRFVFSKESFNEQFTFGIYLFGSNILNTLSDNIHASILGKVVSLQQTGYFVQAAKVKNLPINFMRIVIDRTVFPVFAKIKDDNIFKTEYRKLTQSLFSVVLPLLFFLILVSEDLAIILLGKKWREAGWMMSFLFVSSIPLFVQLMCRNALKSLGYTKQIFINEVLKSVLTFIALFLTFKLGIFYIIMGIVISQFISTLLIMLVLSNKLDYSFVLQLKDLFPVLIINIFIYVVVLISFMNWKIEPFVHFILVFIEYLILLVGLALLFKQRNLIILFMAVINKIKSVLRK